MRFRTAAVAIACAGAFFGTPSTVSAYSQCISLTVELVYPRADSVVPANGWLIFRDDELDCVDFLLSSEGMSVGALFRNWSRAIAMAPIDGFSAGAEYSVWVGGEEVTFSTGSTVTDGLTQAAEFTVEEIAFNPVHDDRDLRNYRVTVSAQFPEPDLTAAGFIRTEPPAADVVDLTRAVHVLRLEPDASARSTFWMTLPPAPEFCLVMHPLAPSLQAGPATEVCAAAEINHELPRSPAANVDSDGGCNCVSPRHSIGNSEAASDSAALVVAVTWLFCLARRRRRRWPKACSQPDPS